MKELVFIYDKLKDEEVQKKVFGRVVKSEKDVLRGWKKTKIMMGDEIYPIVVQDYGASVTGIVILIDVDELDKLDDFKTSRYVRRKVNLESGRDGWIYVRA